MKMSDVIRVTPEKLRETALMFQAAAEEVDSLTGEMTGTVASLSGRIWSGDAAKMYTGRFQGLQKDIARLSRMIRDHVANLTQIAGEYERAEQLNRQEAGALQRELNL